MTDYMTNADNFKKRKSLKIINRIYTFLIFLFLYMPIGVLIVLSFNASKSRGKWGGFTLEWYAQLFSDRMIRPALENTLLVALIAAVVSTIVGTIAAIGIYNMKYLGRKLTLNINYLPVLNPDIVTGIALMMLFLSFKMELGLFTMIIAHVTFNIPYVVLSILPKLRQMNKHTAEAAMDLGATPFLALRKVIIPEILPGIITGMLIAFTLSIDDFVISFFTTGNGVNNLSIVIYSMARKGIKPTMYALCTIMFTIVVMLLVIINKRTSKGDELIP